eukprot:1917475-Amphidinium_carterae.1
MPRAQPGGAERSACVSSDLAMAQLPDLQCAVASNASRLMCIEWPLLGAVLLALGGKSEKDK